MEYVLRKGEFSLFFIAMLIMRKLKPKGVLIPIGGREAKKEKMDVLHRVMKESKKRQPKICVITLATNLPKEVAQDYKSAFKELGLKKVSSIHFESRTDADSIENISMINECSIVLFTGGNQLKLTSLLGGTELLKIIKQRYYDEPHFVIAGTSARSGSHVEYDDHFRYQPRCNDKRRAGAYYWIGSDQ